VSVADLLDDRQASDDVHEPQGGIFFKDRREGMCADSERHVLVSIKTQKIPTAPRANPLTL
jgi:hypothetical protein